MFSARDISPDQEVSRLRTMYGSPHDRMRLLPKSHDATVWNGPGASDPPADLEHVVAAERVIFGTDGERAEVTVLGWPELDNPVDHAQWTADFSDHACLVFEVAGAG